MAEPPDDRRRIGLRQTPHVGDAPGGQGTGEDHQTHVGHAERGRAGVGGPGEGAGSERGPELTVANCKATLRALLPEFAKQRDVLFVYLTIPPLAPKTWPEPVWKLGAKKLLGRPSNADRLRAWSSLAKSFNDWVIAPDGWLAGYEHKNVAVFDLYGVLTGGGTLLRYPSGDGGDSHPNREGNAKVAAELVPFLNRHVRRAGLVAD